MLTFWLFLAFLVLVATAPRWLAVLADAREQWELDHRGDHSDDCVDDPFWDKRRWWR